MNDYGYIKRNYEALLAELSEISARVGKKEPKLVAVTKSATDDEVLALAALGVTAIGENRPQELARRGALLREHGFTPELHQIGSLQSNKVKLVAPIASLIHSVDSESQLRELERASERLSSSIPVLIEVNSACEPQKGGILPDDVERFLEKVLRTSGVRPLGLMTMGPATHDGETLRPYFNLCYSLFEKLKEQYGFSDEPVLSMGMSDSYGVAIECGSTLVRVGRKLFIK